jgi:hypothetical protein
VNVVAAFRPARMLVELDGRNCGETGPLEEFRQLHD